MNSKLYKSKMYIVFLGLYTFIPALLQVDTASFTPSLGGSASITRPVNTSLLSFKFLY